MDSNELIYNEQYQATSSFSRRPPGKRAGSFTDNPLYSNPDVDDCDTPRDKLSAPLPPLPEEDADGYACVVPIHKRERAMTSPTPSDYLKPVLSPQHTREKLLPPPDNSTVFENRSSGIYEDPDYTPTPKRRTASESHKTTASVTLAAAAVKLGRAEWSGSGDRSGQYVARVSGKGGTNTNGNRYVKNFGGAEPVSGGANDEARAAASDYEEPTTKKNSTKS